MNAYDFVPLVGEAPDRNKETRLHHKFHSLNGRMECTLTARTPLFVPRGQAYRTERSRAHETLTFFRDTQRCPAIPGTSLKGVIRSVAEAAANACLILPNRLSYERQRVEYDLPPGFRACNDLKRLCPACHLFGMLNRGTVFAGNVTVGDATAQPGYKMQRFTLAVLSAPKPRHVAFYSKEIDRNKPPVRGRKFYYHHRQGPQLRAERDGQNKTVEAVLPGAVFTFEVEYINLTDEDLNLLLFALVLWEDTCHKIGMGKPIGLGSAKIRITEIRQLNCRARYRQLNSGWESALTGAALERFVDERVASYREERAGNLKDLHRILSWDHAPANLSYPGQEWFRSNPRTPLEGAP
ncbi:MAG: RAMP superfamily CRISPR-associated protein [Gammaproteobacteria bacterium]